MLPPSWIGIQNEDVFLWCFPQDTDSEQVTYVEKKVSLLGAKILLVRDEDRGLIVSRMAKDVPPAMFHIHADLASISYPVDLASRIFMITTHLVPSSKLELAHSVDLLRFKYNYEASHGYESMHGETELKTHSSELPNLLFDFLTIRGKRIIDIHVGNNEIVVYARFREGLLQNSNDIAVHYVDEFQSILTAIKSIIN